MCMLHAPDEIISLGIHVKDQGILELPNLRMKVTKQDMQGPKSRLLHNARVRPTAIVFM